MAIYDRGYRPYRGLYLPPGGAAFKAIFWASMRRPWRTRGLRMLLVSAQMSAVFVCVSLYIQVFVEGKLGGGGVPLAEVGSLSGPLRWLLDQNYLFYNFLLVQLWAVALLVALISGADAIAGDIRAGAMPLYFSRPVTRTSYLGGKLLAILVYLTTVTVVPAVLVLAFRLSFSGGDDFVRAFTTVAPLVAGAAVVDLSVALLVLGCSAAGGRAWAARIAFVTVWLLPYWVAEGVTSITGRSFLAYLSLPHLVTEVLAFFFQQETRLYLAGVVPALALWLGGIVAFLYWRMQRAAELT